MPNLNTQFKNRTLFIFKALFFVIMGVGCSQQIGSSTELKDELNALTEEYLKTHDLASGAILYVSIPDEIEIIKTAGFTDKNKSKGLNGDELFIAASITKTFLAVCILQQIEEGILSLDDLVIKYIDEDVIRKLTNFKGDSSENRLTIEHLLRHKSGIVDYLNKGKVHIDGLQNNPARNYSINDRIEFALSLGENSALSSIGKYNYSNTNYLLLGAIAEKIEGKRISEIFDERIIKPLKLENTSLNPNQDLKGKMFSGYFEDQNLTEFTFEFNKENPAAGILTNVKDLVTFGRSAFTGKLFKNEQTLSKMLDFEKGYGLGVMQFGKTSKTGRILGHSGFDPGYTSYLIYLEKVDACIVTVINQSELRVELPAFLPVKSVDAVKRFL